MIRGIVENLFNPERLERLFNETAVVSPSTLANFRS